MDPASAISDPKVASFWSTKVNIFDIDTESRRAVQEFLTTDYVSWLQIRNPGRDPLEEYVWEGRTNCNRIAFFSELSFGK